MMTGAAIAAELVRELFDQVEVLRAVRREFGVADLVREIAERHVERAIDAVLEDGEPELELPA
jgi:hypothetical protein